VTDALRELENAQQAEQWVKSTLDSLTDAIIVTDALGFIRDINTAAEQLLNWTIAKSVGTSLDQELLLHWVEENSQQKRSVTVCLDHPQIGIASALTRDGRRVQVEVATSPWWTERVA